MRYPFTKLPGQTDGYKRPIVSVVIEGFTRSPQGCLLDTGTIHNRVGAWFAHRHGIDLTGVAEEKIALGGFTSVVRTVPVRLAIGDFEWEAPVSFCDPWPLPFHLLGQEGFFRWFRVEIRAAQLTIDVEPEDR